MTTSQQQMKGEIWMEVRDYRRLASIVIVQELSHRQIAQALGWQAHSYVGRLLRGEVKTLSIEAAARFAQLLGMPINDLFVTRVSTNPARSGQRPRTAA